MIKVSKEEIQISMSSEAQAQINLIKDNDYTIEQLVLRLKISGKGCNGFDYEIGFSEFHNDDLIIEVNSINLHIDPFTAYYCKNGEIDFIQDHSNNVEGFIFTNLNEKTYRGKFFKNEKHLPLTEAST